MDHFICTMRFPILVIHFYILNQAARISRDMFRIWSLTQSMLTWDGQESLHKFFLHRIFSLPDDLPCCREFRSPLPAAPPAADLCRYRVTTRLGHQTAGRSATETEDIVRSDYYHISRIKSQNLIPSSLVLQLSLPNPLKLGVKSRMKM